MNPNTPHDNDRVIDAQVAASLRIANDDNGSEISEETARFITQDLSSHQDYIDDLNNSKEQLFNEIDSILFSGNNVDEADETDTTASSHKAPKEFIEAILISVFASKVATTEFPLGRFRYNKFTYFAHRKIEDDVAVQFQKKAAGPYSPWSRYKGPEEIAVKNNYLKRIKSGKRSGLVPGDNIEAAMKYHERYPICSCVDWVLENLKYKNNDELELLSTVDFASVEIRDRGEEVSAALVKRIISENKEWAPKLNRQIFSDLNIIRALSELKKLFPGTYS